MPVRGKKVLEPEIIKDGENTIVKKSPLMSSVGKYLDTIDKSYRDKVQEGIERVISADGDKFNTVFIRFSNSWDDEELDEAENERIIKNVLLHYFAVPVLKPTAKTLVVEVLPKVEGEPYTISFFEQGNVT